MRCRKLAHCLVNDMARVRSSNRVLRQAMGVSMNVQRTILGVGTTVAATLALALGSAARADVLYDFDYTMVTDNNGGTDYTGQFDVSGGMIVGITGVSSVY